MDLAVGRQIGCTLLLLQRRRVNRIIQLLLVHLWTHQIGLCLSFNECHVSNFENSLRKATKFDYDFFGALDCRGIKQRCMVT